jgi:hypothetical protein
MERRIQPELPSNPRLCCRKIPMSRPERGLVDVLLYDQFRSFHLPTYERCNNEPFSFKEVVAYLTIVSAVLPPS